MSSLLFLLFTTIKNQILQLRRKPGILVLYLVLVGMLLFTLFTGTGSPKAPARQGLAWLELIFASYLLLFYFMSISKGLSEGGSFFDMCDVHFLFPAPLSPKTILGYGLLRTAGHMLLAGVFILFQSSLLRSLGLPSVAVLLYLLGFALAVLLFEALAMCLYTYTSRHPLRKRVVQVAACLPLVPFALLFLRSYAAGNGIEQALLAGVHGGALLFWPVAGWVTACISGVLTGNMVQALLYGGLSVACGVLLLLLVTLGKSDYYEDVLVATQTAFQKKRAAADGDLQALSHTKRKVRARTNQTLWGAGAQVFLSKHLLESSRANPLKLLDRSSLILLAVAWCMGAFLREEGVFSSILPVTLYLQAFLVGNGRGLKELFMHYIYLVPSSSFTKIVWSNLEVLLKSVVEGVLLWLPLLYLTGITVAQALLCMLVYAVFSLLLVTVNILSMRVFKDILSKGLLLVLYMLFVAVVMLPGVVLAIVLSVQLGVVVALLGLLVWECVLSVLFLYLSRGVLHACDMPVMQTKV